MKKSSEKSKKIFFLPLAVFAAVVLSSLVYVFAFDREALPHAFFTDLFVLVAASLVLMGISLKRSLAETLYSYKNILLIGGILFFTVLAAVLLKNFIVSAFAKNVTVSDIYLNILAFPKRFSFYAVFPLSAISIALFISNVSLIKHEGFRMKNLFSVFISAFYLGGTALIYILSDIFEKNVLIPNGLNERPLFAAINTCLPLFLLLIICYFECILVGTAVMGYAAAKQKPAYDKDFIIILGCRIDKKGGLLPLLRQRVNRAVKYAWDQEIASGKPLKYVPSGGQSYGEVISEGSAMELYLLSHGAEQDEVYPEKQSKNTYENMLFSKKIIDSLKPDAKIAFATTNYHMLRSGILAQKAGIDAEGIASKTKWYFWPNGFLREFVGILDMNRKAHYIAAAVIALLCLAVGIIEFFGILA